MKLYNTPHKQVETIEPQDDQQVTIYTCGPTVYDYPHIGNWFTFIRYDMLIRALKLEGLQPKWVMNITDVGHLVSDADEGEDKLEKGAKREGKTAWEIAEAYTDNFTQGLEALNSTQPDKLPKATDHIVEQIELVKRLDEKGFAYKIDDGVYFDTSKFPTYADFAHLDLAGQESGARVAINSQKRQPTDFALWKFSPSDSQRDMEWDSPWGKGFPGWHLECSAMSMKYLGETIDIHAGGIDHIPVHHTNEIAQSEAATGKQFVNYWMHTNHISVDGAKIAKSDGNSITLEDLHDAGVSALALRMLILESHYRTQSVFTWETLHAAEQRLRSLQAFADLQHQINDQAAELSEPHFDEAEKAIRESLGNDLNTPEALTALSKLISQVMADRSGLKATDHDRFRQFLKFLDDALGFDLSKRTDINDQQKALISQRQAAREKQDWQKSDEIRDQLQKSGIGVNDSATRGLWYRLEA